MKELLDKLLGKEVILRNRIFRVILLAAVAAAAFGITEELLMQDTRMMLVPMMILAVAILVSVVTNFKFHMVQLSSWILGLSLILGVFPTVYFFSGGVNGGATIWFVLGIVYVFLMFDGWQMLFLLGLALSAIFTCYLLGFVNPEVIHNMESRQMVLMDSSFSVVVVSLVIGVIIRYQIYVYDQERKINQIQKQELEDAGRARNLFFAKISHEIRTPINTVIGLNEMNLRDKLAPDILENSIKIQQAAVSLLALVNELLDLSQIQTSKMTLFESEYDTKNMFLNLMDIIQIRMRSKKLSFHMELDPNLPSQLKGDEKRINQILINLLANAVKYTEQGSISMEAHLETISDSRIWLIVSVTDTGLGIRKEDIPFLFDSFHRMDERNTHKIEGSGLGLSITKQLIELMEGEISVDSIYKKGSTFMVRIPQSVSDPSPIGAVDFLSHMRGRQKMMQTGKPYSPKFEAPEARLLIVDDSHMNIEVLRKLLGATKVQIDSAESGEEALALTRKRFYHLIFLDYMMPGMNGIEVLQAIRQQDGGLCAETPIVCLTGNARTDSGNREMSYGFDGYLQKPVRGELLEGTILRYLPHEIVEYVREEEDPQAEEILMSQLHVGKISNRRKKRVCITTNCLCDLSRERCEQYGIRMIFPYIETEKGRFLDTLEIDGKNMTRYLSDFESHAKAISPTVEDYETFFADTLEEAEDVIHISVAKNTGDSYENAMTASRSFDHVRVINSGLLSGGLGLLVVHAAKLARKGMSAASIIESVQGIKSNINTTFMFPTVKALHRNGFANKLQFVVTESFKLHPIYEIRDNGLRFVSFRTGNVEIARRHFIHTLFFFKRRIDPSIVYVTHADCSIKEMDQVMRELRKSLDFEQVIVERSCVANSVTSGLGTIGIAFFRK